MDYSPLIRAQVAHMWLLYQHGNVVYHGSREDLLGHFARAGFVCPPLYNPSDYCMDLISFDVRGERTQKASSARIKTLIQHWKIHETMLSKPSFESSEIREHRHISSPPEDRPECTPIHVALPVVLNRTFRNTWRQPDLFWTRYVQKLCACPYSADHGTGGFKPPHWPSFSSSSSSV